MRSQVQLPKSHIMKLNHFVMLTFQEKLNKENATILSNAAPLPD